MLTQIGGVLLLLNSVFCSYFDKLQLNKPISVGINMTSFVFLYSIVSIFVVPPLAKLNNRVPMPVSDNKNLKPLNKLTCFLNRHYVDVELHELMIHLSKEIHFEYEKTQINYLDANFPFFNFPLLPHLSHNDGRKLDIALFYLDAKTGKACSDVPSIIGYGVYEDPKSNEVNTSKYCLEKGYWQYSFSSKLVNQSNKSNFIFDNQRNQFALNLLSKHPSVEKVFIEPHLKLRLNLKSNKIKFHGCHSVRHDDHIHIQIK